MATVLETKGLSGGYGKVVAFRDIDLQIEGGEVLAVLGPNGAGKTTLMMTIAGLLPHLGGEVRLEGKPLPSGRPNVANVAGVVLVPDDRALFTSLTVRENLMVARVKAGMTLDEVYDLFPSLAKRASVAAGALSGGEQQMLAVARGMVQRPKVLLIDEMSMGLAPIVVDSLLPVVRRIADETSAAVILVEQHVRLALDVAERAILLVHGQQVLSCPAAELRDDPARLEAAYFGVGVA